MGLHIFPTVKEIKALKKGDRVILYYTGHPPVNKQLSNTKATVISVHKSTLFVNPDIYADDIGLSVSFNQIYKIIKTIV
jgi:hypothetical protein